MEEKRLPFWEIFKTLIIFTVAFVVVIFVSKTIDSLFLKKKQQEPIPTQTMDRSVVSCSPDFLSYQDLTKGKGQTTFLIDERKPMFAKDGRFVKSIVVLTKSETETSKVACGYLFIRTGTSKGPLQNWENVVINPSGFGGHINPESAKSVNDSERESAYLYSLGKIQYWPTHNRQNLQTADWAALLNVQPEVPFLIALNTEDKTGFIEEITIAYKCWDPETGKENKDCKLSVESKSDTLTDILK